MRIGVIGWYGHGNAGDERILYCLKRFLGGHQYLVTSGFGNAAKRLEQLNACDYVLMGGGGLILRGLNKYAELIEQITPPLGCVGISVEACHEDNQTFIDVLKDKSEYILVRDQESCDLLGSHSKVVVSSDLSFLYPFEVVDPPGADVCGVNLRNWYFRRCEHDPESYAQAMRSVKRDPSIEENYHGPKWEPAKAVDTIAGRFSKVVPVPLYFGGNSESDHVLLRTLFDAVDETISFQDAYRVCRYFIGMRLHSVIFACQMGIPFASLSYQPKNERFCRALDLEKLSVDLFHAGELDDAITILQDSHEDLRERLLDFRERACADIRSKMSDVRKQVLARSTAGGIVSAKQARVCGAEDRSVPSTPRVSVVLPTYNDLRFLPGAIDSVLGQSFQDFELVVVNDGSTDGTKAYLDGFNDPRVRVIHQENRRLPEALNAGFRAARGDLLTWTSADNYCAPGFLEHLVGALEAYPEAGFAYSDFANIDKDGQVISVRENPSLTYHDLLAGNPGVASFMYRRACQDKVGYYDPSMECAEDWDYWLRILEHFETVYVPQVLYHYRRHEDGMSQRMPERVYRASRRVFDKAMERRNHKVDLRELYPAIRLCRCEELAMFHAGLDFGARLLQSRFADPAVAVRVLEQVRGRESRTVHVISNLAVAYARLGQWDHVLPLLREMMGHTEDGRVLGVCRAIIAAQRADDPQSLAEVMLFRPDRRNSELFQIEAQAKCRACLTRLADGKGRAMPCRFRQTR